MARDVRLIGALAAAAIAVGCGDPFDVQPSSCRDLVDGDSAGVDGVYELSVTGTSSEPTLRAWCDLSTDGGGWTLVARTARGGNTAGWGWHGATGSVDDLSRSYSLGIAELSMPFQEILVADLNETTGGIAAHGYVGQAPANLFATCGDRSCGWSSLRTVVGDCRPNPDPYGLRSMLTFIGYTGSDEIYFFRDEEDFSPFGLHPDGWGLAGGDGNVSECDRNGELHGEPGLIMVR